MSSSLFSNNLRKLGIHFEAYVFGLLKEKYPNCGVTSQVRLDSGLRPDFILQCDNEVIIAEAKDKERIGKEDVDQVTGYINELDADYGIIFVADYTEVPESVEDYATINATEIRYTNWRYSK